MGATPQPHNIEAGPVVFTNKAHCRDCYRCLRVCPVKAIRMKDGQAYVDDDRCIGCGTCIRECPQSAKTYRHDLGRAVRILEGDDPVAVSLAPSFAAAFKRPAAVPAALRKLGFMHVAETAVGASHAAKATVDYLEQKPDSCGNLCGACPAVVKFIESYRPDAAGRLVPVASPMVMHARHIKRTLGEGWKVIFIGPCVAKKKEAERGEYAGLIDCVLTFEELDEWFEREKINLDEMPDDAFDEQPGKDARLFPIEGGEAKTAQMPTDYTDGKMVIVSGIDNLQAALDATSPEARVIEPLFCPQGCINGPAFGREDNLFDRKEKILAYSRENPGTGESAPHPDDSSTDMKTEAVSTKQYSDTEIEAVLARTGKADPADRLNCGACGYNSCWEKAIAVLEGMAEEEMCIPRMRRLAEQRSDRITETSPNGILMVSKDLKILSMNPAFRKMFFCTDGVLGKPISYLMDADPFEKLAARQSGPITQTVEHKRYHRLCHQVLYRLEEENQIVGIFVDITESWMTRSRLDHLRSELALQARALLEHQEETSRQMARLLGENAAQGQQLLEKLTQLAGEPTTGDESWEPSTQK